MNSHPCSACGTPYDTCEVMVVKNSRNCCGRCALVSTHDAAPEPVLSRTVAEALYLAGVGVDEIERLRSAVGTLEDVQRRANEALGKFVVHTVNFRDHEIHCGTLNHPIQVAFDADLVTCPDCRKMWSS